MGEHPGPRPGFCGGWMASFGFEVAGTAVPRGVDAGIGVEAGLSWAGGVAGGEGGGVGGRGGGGAGGAGGWRARAGVGVGIREDSSTPPQAEARALFRWEDIGSYRG